MCNFLARLFCCLWTSEATSAMKTLASLLSSVRRAARQVRVLASFPLLKNRLTQARLKKAQIDGRIGSLEGLIYLWGQRGREWFLLCYAVLRNRK